MSGSRKPGPNRLPSPGHLRDQLAPARSPGILGVNDAGDPTSFSLLGDTPGTSGINDHGSPDRLNVPALRTLHAWLDEASVHLQPAMQVAHYHPAGNVTAVMAKANEFILRWEGIRAYPYVPGASSGITIGVGYDIGQTSEQQFREDWAELATQPVKSGTSERDSLGVSQQAPRESSFSLGVDTSLGPPAPKPLKTFPFESALFTPLDRLAQATRGKLSHSEAVEYLKEVQEIAIPRELSLKVFADCSLPRFYKSLMRAMPGVTDLPTGVQVALLSLVFNRGTGTKDKDGGDDILGPRWEMGELPRAVMAKDLVWIYWYVESMRRVWASKRDKTSAGLVKRRDAELALIYPYVASDVQHEAFLQRHPRWK